MSETAKLVLGTAVLVGRRAVLLRGPSGCGKSSVALALIARDGPDRPVRLVADDAVHARRIGDSVLVTPPPATRGLVEMRGAGVRRVPFAERAVLGLVVDLSDEIEPRLPEEADCIASICGAEVARIVADPSAASVTDTVLSLMGALEQGCRPPFFDAPGKGGNTPT